MSLQQRPALLWICKAGGIDLSIRLKIWYCKTSSDLWKCWPLWRVARNWCFYWCIRWWYLRFIALNWIGWFGSSIQICPSKKNTCSKYITAPGVDKSFDYRTGSQCYVCCVCVTHWALAPCVLRICFLPLVLPRCFNLVALWKKKKRYTFDKLQCSFFGWAKELIKDC